MLGWLINECGAVGGMLTDLASNSGHHSWKPVIKCLSYGMAVNTLFHIPTYCTNLSRAIFTFRPTQNSPFCHIRSVCHLIILWIYLLYEHGLNMKEAITLHFSIKYFTFFNLNRIECWKFGYKYSYTDWLILVNIYLILSQGLKWETDCYTYHQNVCLNTSEKLNFTGTWSCSWVM
jgi:hypothetical protein